MQIAHPDKILFPKKIDVYRNCATVTYVFKNIYPTHFAGTSAGAIVGALYAAGHGWQEILDFFKTVQLFSIDKYARSKPGFVDTEKFHGSFAKYLPVDDFAALKTPLYITATRILDGTLKVFHQGELIRPVLASAAFPGVFAPEKIDEGYYSDVGILNNFPSDLIRMYCHQLIGVYVNPFEKVKIQDLRHSYTIMERAYKIRMAKDSLDKFKECHQVISPKDLTNYSTFSLKNMDAIFEVGYVCHQKGFAKLAYLTRKGGREGRIGSHERVCDESREE
ncbi:NTE family protein [Pricia antarctica]|uniref:NTE family protein n=1 Tax=Pricia antarctica TaxID=641691 RepID=A0A1G7D377_9FLAO|nr:patatin-like phospholipase family protein [Pricia antarctica]SDE45943.1 NTE family protein [Pricia antarctica]